MNRTPSRLRECPKLSEYRPYEPSAYTIFQLEAPLILFIAIFRPLFVYNCANTHTSVLKNLTFPNYKFGKGKYAPTLTNWVGGLGGLGWQEVKWVNEVNKVEEVIG